ncbi:hypothetical protein CBR_g2947 [Chara braunii]|uniref:Uncharacterized protein n=1 Tax=Chara braunii TaxID=69332 RepID=A0A388KEB5_CHABU|nr:hypothetical protein CBR_g2947 [Chara braunii]|eukprot:GBG68402.1 hypothetical protein CBR_g2947 [Chara braunii]
MGDRDGSKVNGFLIVVRMAGQGMSDAISSMPKSAYNRYSIDFSDPNTLIRRIDQMRKEREARFEEFRAWRAQEEVRECTFTPAIKENVPKNHGPVVVCGLGRYFELREIARRLESERQEREKKVFLSQCSESDLI